MQFCFVVTLPCAVHRSEHLSKLSKSRLFFAYFPIHFCKESTIIGRGRLCPCALPRCQTLVYLCYPCLECSLLTKSPAAHNCPLSDPLDKHMLCCQCYSCLGSFIGQVPFSTVLMESGS